MLEMVADLKAQGRGPQDVLDDLARKCGLYATSQLSVRVSDLALISDAMARLRAAPPAVLGGREVLVSPGADWLYGYDPETGRELWRMSYGVLGFSIVPRPVTAHGLLYLSTSFMQPELLAVKLTGPDTPPEIVWREKKGAPNMPSPLVVGDELYMVSDKGVASCLDAKTGTPAWSERLGGNFTSSPLFADGHIYVGNRDGVTFVLEPGRSYKQLSANQLEGQIFATPAAVGRAVYLRTDKAVYRLQKGGARP